MIWFNSRLQNQQRSLSNLSWQATHDPLTKFLNRRGFDVEIKRFFEIAKTTNTQHVVLIIDIDNFKGINDTYGHSAGDELLKQLGVNLPALVHTDDVIARLGGDEFALLLRDCNEEEGRTIAENIRQKIFGSGIEFDGKHIPATASIGAAVMSSANASTREVLTDADIACYISKRGGRNQVHVYHQNDSKLSE